MDQTQDSQDPLPDDIVKAQEEIKRLRSELTQCQKIADNAVHDTRSFCALAEHIQEVFWMTNPLGNELFYISPAYQKIWGQSCQSLRENPGQRLAWVHDADRERVLKAFLRDARNGEYDETYRINRPDGGIRWIRDRAYPIRDAAGEVYRLAGFATDLTNEIEARDRHSAFQQQIAADERFNLSASLGKVIAHELAQPLTSAANFIKLARIESGEQPPRVAELLEQAGQQIKRTATILTHLRDFAHDGNPSISQHALSHVLAEVRGLFEANLRSARIRLEWPETGALAGLEMPMDRIFVQQILRNLLRNAVEALTTSATPADQRCLSVAVETSRPDQVGIYVSDNGDGIDQDIQLFTPFATSKGGGLGLGLILSRSLARSQGGDLELTRDGHGENQTTCFRLSLPREPINPAA